MRTQGTGAVCAVTHTHTHTAVRWSWPVALDCLLWSPPHGRHGSYRSWWRQLQVTFLCSPPSYLSICLYFSFIHLSSLHFLISSFLLSPFSLPLIPYTLRMSKDLLLLPFYGRAQDSRLYCVEYSKPNPSHNAAVRHREHTQFSYSLWGMFLKLT